MIKSISLCCLLFALFSLSASAQVTADANAVGHNINIGGEYALFDSDYFGGNHSLNASSYAIYANYGIFGGRWPIGVEANFTHEIGSHNDHRSLFSFLAGPRVGYHIGRLEPFAKAGAGFGHFIADNLPYSQQYGNHFAIGFGGGLDYHLTRRITLRPVDYTYERWNFTPHSLSPSTLGFGVSYRIH